MFIPFTLLANEPIKGKKPISVYSATVGKPDGKDCIKQDGKCLVLSSKPVTVFINYTYEVNEDQRAISLLVDSVEGKPLAEYSKSNIDSTMVSMVDGKIVFTGKVRSALAPDKFQMSFADKTALKEVESMLKDDRK